jgi:hypothetical protein
VLEKGYTGNKLIFDKITMTNEPSTTNEKTMVWVVFIWASCSGSTHCGRSAAAVIKFAHKIVVKTQLFLVFIGDVTLEELIPPRCDDVC